ncbi:MAG: peptidylprolyl isomerase [Pseudomonadota bacterium]|nr:peptidylprolyl isomerase [Pseudomonadota bacterium]
MRIVLPLLAALLLAACQPSNAPVSNGDGTVSVPKSSVEAPSSPNEAPADPTASAGADNDIVYLDTKDGRITIRLRPDLAPNHVARIKTLVKQGFYDGIVFHRVIDGFMAQTGDPTGTGRGGSDLPDLEAEFSAVPFTRGILGMARAQSPDSANSQFFIRFAEGDFLNGKYTVFGEVVDGMYVVDKIRKGDSDANGMVENPDKIIKMRLKSDAG